MELKELIRNAEARFIWYKNEIELVGRDRINFPLTDELVIWYKAHLREMKNLEEGHLKELVKERQYANQGLNPPFCYRH
jgi:hypothetical protein